MFDLGLGSVELAFLGASSKADIALARQFMAHYGERWPEQWLRQRGLDGAAEYWRSCQPHEMASPVVDSFEPLAVAS